jgi:hypothetical protein
MAILAAPVWSAGMVCGVRDYSGFPWVEALIKYVLTSVQETLGWLELFERKAKALKK